MVMMTQASSTCNTCIELSKAKGALTVTRVVDPVVSIFISMVVSTERVKWVGLLVDVITKSVDDKAVVDESVV